MAGFFSAAAPEYVTPSGTSMVTKTSGGLLGMFPGTPEYAKADAATVPASGAPTSGSSLPADTAGVEVRIAIPGLLHLQGAIAIPPWLPQLAPVLAPALLELVREWLARQVCPVDPPPVDPAANVPPARNPAARPETEQRVWDRD